MCEPILAVPPGSLVRISLTGQRKAGHTAAYGVAGYRKETQVRGAGRVVFAAILLLLVGTLNIIYGIGAVADANFYANDTRYIFTNLSAMGWFLIIVGVIQLTGGFSLLSGNPYGRLIGIVAGSLGAIDALLSMGEHHPFWNLAIFALCVWVVYGIVVYGEDERVEAR
jgi:tetrahydromethanopterin S-methyltransferase subunit C